ncbi:undecaprenyl diphosphate synthase [Sphingobium sp. B2D3A]|uniref:isoprenyl transferase n=1 Tax=unclassified Sphingobium TaxID=2611147 RepID=UPI0022252DE6|nr:MULTISPECIES: isoprenyl transferase [unclassified Sphingobium]MCW2337767.1 undecaprenyl diphosphate synthase [Sphingobium sp. B2D3A]MCW2384225.1 undecaprenyl diphosphate synthase [Sphingobium sp. B2D3D]
MTRKAAPTPVQTGGEGAVPRHVAIIMDGNGRWAKARRLPRVAGHRAGAEAVRRTLRAASKLGIECVTLYAFSSENWKRPEDEIADLTGLMKQFLRSEVDDLHEAGIRLKIIGNHHAFEPEAAAMVDAAVARTAANTASTLVVALNYGSQDELARAMRALAQQVQAGTLAPEAITPAVIAAQLDTADLPPLDLLIRTSGEVRLSNFLLWQAAYAELYFTETLWPDFDEAALATAVESYACRERRYGGR